MSETAILERGGRRLAWRRREGAGPTILFLPGYASDMEGSKATALDAWAAAEGRAMIRFDYGGCGASPGDFEAQSLEDWRNDAIAMIEAAAGPVLLVGSSMGGWLTLLAALARPERVARLVGIAAAPDFTSWGYSEAEKETIRTQGRLARPSPAGEPPMVTTRTFWESGERNLLLGGGKEGVLYLLNADNLGRMVPNDTQIVQKIPVTGGHVMGGAVYWNSANLGPMVYNWSEDDALKSYRLSGGRLALPAHAQGLPISPGHPGGSLTVSANGNASDSGIVWSSMPAFSDAIHGLHAGVLRAFNAETLSEIWSSERNPTRDRAGTLRSA